MLKLKLIIFLFISINIDAYSQKLTLEEKAVFDEIVYQRKKVGEYETLTKWGKPIRYKIYGDTSEYLVKEVDSFFNFIKKITSLDIKKADINNKENFAIIFGAKLDGFKKFEGSPSENPFSYLIVWTSNYDFMKASISLNTKKLGSNTNIKNAFKKIIFKCLGFYKDSELAPNSIFNMKASSHKITDFDLHIISALYNKKIKGGMTKDEVDKILNQE